MMKVSPEAVNFDQVNVGDQITATVTEKIVVSLAKEGTTSEDATLAPKGGQPAGLDGGNHANNCHGHRD